MTDFFALFTLPRQPWIDPDVVKEKYYQLTRVVHPDIAAHAPSAQFAQINEAYRVLSDPKLRIVHLLALENGASTAVDREPPEDLQDYFLQIGMLSQKMQRLLDQYRVGSGALTLSLFKTDLVQLQSQIAQLLAQLSRAYEYCLAELESLNEFWKQDRDQAVIKLRRLHNRIAYLSRWVAQLKEMEFQLTVTD